MLKLFAIGLLCLTLSAVNALGQVTLETFSRPDGAFQFVYPQTYQLLVGERMLKATQGTRGGITVCDFATALACVIYPLEPSSVEAANDTRFEAAGFSVHWVTEAASESDCLTYADLLAQMHGEHLPVTAVALNDHVFRHASFTKAIPGHKQAADVYRTFHQQKCYEVLIAISMADQPGLQKAAQTTSLGDPRADSAREALRLVFSSLVFEKK